MIICTEQKASGSLWTSRGDLEVTLTRKISCGRRSPKIVSYREADTSEINAFFPIVPVIHIYHNLWKQNIDVIYFYMYLTQCIKWLLSWGTQNIYKNDHDCFSAKMKLLVVTGIKQFTIQFKFVGRFFLKKLILLFSKDALLNWSKMTLKTSRMVQNSIHQRKKPDKTITISTKTLSSSTVFSTDNNN